MFTKGKGLAALLVVVLLYIIVGTSAAQKAKIQDSKTGGTNLDIITSVPRDMTYQGILKDAEGNPVTETAVDIKFKIFNAEFGGNELPWLDIEHVTTDDGGRFSATLGNIDLPFDEDYWLELWIVGEGQPMSPRQKINLSAYAAVADTSNFAEYAGNADLLDGLDSGDFLSTASDYGRSGVASDLYEGTSTLTDKYINSTGPDTIYSNGLGDTAFVGYHYTDGIGIMGKAFGSSGYVGTVGVLGAAYQGGSIAVASKGVVGFGQNTTYFGGEAYGGFFYTDSEGSGLHYGVYGYSSDYGVYGAGPGEGGTYGVYYSGGLAGTGSKSCVVKTSQGPTLLYCQESPENWFEDFGEGRLADGRTHIELDRLYLETVTVDDSNPMKVFVQLEGDCNGVYVSKGTTGFDVIELNKGASNVEFSYRVVAKRKGFEDRRLDYTAAGLDDPILYPEVKEKIEKERLH